VLVKKRLSGRYKKGLEPILSSINPATREDVLLPCSDGIVEIQEVEPAELAYNASLF
jgi:hypothetical protein